MTAGGKRATGRGTMVPGWRPFRGRSAAVVAAWLLMATGAKAGAADWFLASRRDDALLDLVRELDASPAPRVDARLPDVDAVCLVHERILQLERTRYRITENAMYRVLDVEDSELATHHMTFPSHSRIEDAQAWIVRGDRVILCGDTAVKIVHLGGDQPTEVVIALPGVLDGDVIGWSVRRGANRTYPGTSIPLQESIPTRRYTLRVLTDGLVSYRLVGRNLDPGTFKVEVLERKNGTETNTVAEFRDLIEQASGPYAPPPWTSGPMVELNWRGYLDTSIGAWFFNGSWSEAAVSMEGSLADLTEIKGEVRARARKLTADEKTDRDRLAALHDFVRNEIVGVDPDEVRDEERPASEILAARNASGIEAGALLCALARAIDLPVRPVLARSQDLGPIDNGNPGIQQFNELLVEYMAEPGCFCAASRSDCPIGVLPDDLLGATALVLADDLAAKDRAVVEEVFSSIDPTPKLVARYQDRVARLPWQTMFELPGDSSAARSSVAETLSAVAGVDTITVSLAAQGPDGFLSSAPTTDDPAELLARYCSLRLPTATVVAAQPREDAARLSGVLSADMGRSTRNTWVLPTESVLGAPFLADLTLPVTEPFHIAISQDLKRICHVRLPAGWRLAVTPPSLNVANPRFVVSARMGVLGDELIVIREIRLRRGTTARAGLAALEDAVNKVRGFEQKPLLLIHD